MNYTMIELEDIVEIADVFKTTFNSPPWNDSWSKESAVNRINLQISNINSLGFKATHNNIPIGFVLGNYTGFPEGTGFFIDDLCINPDYQNMGIGKALLEAVENDLKNRNINIIITTTAKGMKSFDFYINNGFNENSATVGLFKIIK
jgi:aminoglycoside 6'-N-acetyltransferase I